MKIGAAVRERREEEAGLRQTYNPVADTILEGVFHGVVGKSRLGELHRTDTGQYVLVDLIRSVLHVDPVRGAPRNVIDIMDDQNEVVADIFIVGDDPVIVFFEQGIIPELAVAQPQQKFLCAALLLAL